MLPMVISNMIRQIKRKYRIHHIESLLSSHKSYHKLSLYSSIDREDIFHDRLSETKTASNHLQTVEEPKLSSQCQSSTFFLGLERQ